MEQLVGYLLILLWLVLNLSESLVVRRYATHHSSGGMLMNGVICLFACVFFLLTDKDGFSMPLELLPYGIVSMICYAAGFYSMLLAYRFGSFGLTSLLAKFSLLFPIVYGIFFLNEGSSWLTWVGLAVIAISTVLLKPEEKSGEKHTSLVKWIIALTVTVVSNGFISILTRMQQIRFDNATSNEFLVLSTGGAALFLIAFGLISEGCSLKDFLKHGIGYGAAAGLFNGGKNLTLIFIYLFLPISVVSPVKAALGTVLTFIAATLLYKEKYSLKQKIGVVLGALAVVAFAL